MDQSNGRTFDRNSTTEEVRAGIDLGGKHVLVTGASGGLGEETARALAACGASVTVAARDPEKTTAALARLRAAVPEAAFETLDLDLSVPASVRAATDAWLGGHDRLDILVNNAGVMACPLARTADGWEQQFATNHLGHFLFAIRLLPALLAAAPARVVSLSSGGHKFGPVDFDDPHFERRSYDPWVAYGQSKTANALFAVEWTRRYGPGGVTANAVHPGVIYTELSRHLTQADLDTLLARSPRARTFDPKPVEAGAATSVWAATAPELEGHGGLYLEDCKVAAPAASENQADGYLPHACDPEAAERLWTLSERLLEESAP